MRDGFWTAQLITARPSIHSRDIGVTLQEREGGFHLGLMTDFKKVASGGWVSKGGVAFGTVDLNRWG